MSALPPPRRGLPGTAGSTDKRFRRTDVRPGRRKLFTRVWHASRIGLGVLLAVGALTFASSRVVAAGALAVRHVTVQGHHRLTIGEIEALIGNVRGESILFVDLDRFRARLLDSPWVGDVVARRVLPDTLDVRIFERRPIAIARLSHQLYLVDDDGVVVDEYGPQYRDLDLPIVDGLAAAPAPDGPVIDPRRAALAARFLAALSVRPELKRAVSQVDVSAVDNVVILLGDDPTLLHLGAEQFVERIQTYLELTPALEDRAKVVDYVDLRFGNRVFLKDRK